MDNKRTRDKTRLHLGSRTLGNRNNYQRRVQYRPRHYQHRKTYPTIRRLLHAKTKYLPQPRKILLGKTRGERNTGRTLAKISIPRKKCEFKDIKQEDLLLSKFITSITDKKLREKLIREKTLNLKTTMDLVSQDSYERRRKQSTIPSALAKEKDI